MAFSHFFPYQHIKPTAFWTVLQGQAMLEYKDRMLSFLGLWYSLVESNFLRLKIKGLVDLGRMLPFSP